MESFGSFALKSEKLLVIVNDATRPTPTSTVLKELYPYLKHHPDLKFLIATGAHRAPTEDELRYIFGELLDDFRSMIHVHDARKDEEMVYLGKSSNGTEMYLNRLVTETKNILVIGSVEPHYFAGYTGGRKSFLPGVASYKTIEMNHMHALSDKAAPLSLKGNPVAEDMEDAMKLLNDLHIFSIQTVLTANHGLYAMVAGDLRLSFELAVKKANEVFCAPCRRKGNIVLTVAPYPMDIDLYQSQKALENGKLALEKDGIIILVSKCRDGIGDDTFLKLLCCAQTSEDVMQKIAEGYKLGYHKAAKMVQIGMHAQMWAVSDLDIDTLEMAKLKPHTDLQETFDKAIAAIRAKGKEPYAVILPQGSLTVPLIK
jgi:nickel-dependent lactate racemase